MNTPTETEEIEIVTRFLLRFADLMSTGSNSENLLRAAELLRANACRAQVAEQQLRQERAYSEQLKAQLVELLREDQIQVPASVLRLATSQFEALAREFGRSGDIVSEAMCTASASTLKRALEIRRPFEAHVA